MSLPAPFSNPEEYFQQIVSFFQEYQHLYNFPNTCILINNALDRIDLAIDDNFDVYSENFKLPSVKSRFIRTFLERVENFKTEYEVLEKSDCFLDLGDVPLGPKKKHEIFYLGKEIKRVCEATGSDIVVDFGSGLGYLDQYLHQTTDLKVLGLECNESHYVGAKKRQRKYHLRSTDFVKYIQHTVTKDSDEKIRSFLKDKFPDNEFFCMTGLHACADLTVESVNLFLKMQEAKATVLIPCCYHKMRTKSEEENRFSNFPLSKCLKDIYEKNRGYEFLRIPFLRLAAQPPLHGDGKLENVVFNLLSRAVLEVYAHKHNFNIKRTKRKAVKLKTIHNDFESYIQEAITGFSIKVNDGVQYDDVDTVINFDDEELKRIWNVASEPKTLKKAAIFILLQNELQPVFENFVLYDRLLYLRENGISKSEVRKVFDEKISPRCLAIVAFK